MEESLLDALMQLIPGSGKVLMWLGLIVVSAQSFVLITPTTKDNAFMAKLDGILLVGGLLRAIRAFAPKQKN